ncbi:MAG: type II CAAX endopeptidase family protein [Armatimonadota bacterium]
MSESFPPPMQPEPAPPPPPIDEPPPPPKGAPIVWLGVAFGILFMATMATLGIVVQEGVTADRASLDRELRLLEADYSIALVREGGSDEKAAQGILLDARRRLESIPLQTEGAKYVRYRALLILEMVANPKDRHSVEGLTDATDDITDQEGRNDVAKRRARVNDALRALASGAEGRELEEAAQALKEEAGQSWPLTLALDEARRRMGIANEMLPAPLAFLLVGLVGMGALAWIAYLALRLSGSLQPAGAPIRRFAAAPALVGDSLGLRFFVFLLIYTVVPVVLMIGLSSAFGEGLGTRLMVMALAAPVVLAAIFLPWLGVRLRPGHIGISLRGFGRMALWGVGGWLANLPVLLVLFAVTMFLSRWLPSASHPLGEELSSPGGVAISLIVAAVIAPLIEEVVFRGMLFQGLGLRLRGVLWPVVLSSLAFASVHPQGPATWVVLGWIGAMGCLLVHQTGSLIPAIVMHALHNFTIIVLAVYLENSVGL